MYIYVLFIKGIINDTKAEQPKKFTKVCNSEEEARQEFLRYFRLEGYDGRLFDKAASRLIEKGWNDGTIEDITFLSTLVKIDVTPKAF